MKYRTNVDQWLFACTRKYAKLMKLEILEQLPSGHYIKICIFHHEYQYEYHRSKINLYLWDTPIVTLLKSFRNKLYFSKLSRKFSIIDAYERYFPSNQVNNNDIMRKLTNSNDFSLYKLLTPYNQINQCKIKWHVSMLYFLGLKQNCFYTTNMTHQIKGEIIFLKFKDKFKVFSVR